MAEPYFEGQTPSACGCYYPDVTLVRDFPDDKLRQIHCINHGYRLIPLGNVTEPVITPNPIPGEEWRKAERKRLRSL